MEDRMSLKQNIKEGERLKVELNQGYLRSKNHTPIFVKVKLNKPNSKHLTEQRCFVYVLVGVQGEETSKINQMAYKRGPHK